MEIESLDLQGTYREQEALAGKKGKVAFLQFINST